MEYIRTADTRGTADFGWLKAKHSFSFGNYYDPAHMGFSVLRVINDDRIAAGAGFGTHPHDNMEIITYVTQGGVAHKDSMGNVEVVKAGEIQRMSAGTGITHSEYNASDSTELKLLQIWLLPNQRDIAPSYEQQAVTQQDTVTPLITPTGGHGSLSINQDASLSRVLLAPGQSAQLSHGVNRSGYLHIVGGELSLTTDTASQQGAASIKLQQGDAVGSVVARTLTATNTASAPVEALWFDLPGVAQAA